MNPTVGIAFPDSTDSANYSPLHMLDNSRYVHNTKRRDIQLCGIASKFYQHVFRMDTLLTTYESMGGISGRMAVWT